MYKPAGREIENHEPDANPVDLLYTDQYNMGKFIFQSGRGRLMGDDEAVLKRLGGLYKEVKEASKVKSVKGGYASFDLDLLFSDVLQAVGLLSYANLSHVIGKRSADKIWQDVSA